MEQVRELVHRDPVAIECAGILRRIEVYANGRYMGKAQLTEDDQ